MAGARSLLLLLLLLLRLKSGHKRGLDGIEFHGRLMRRSGLSPLFILFLLLAFLRLVLLCLWLTQLQISVERVVLFQTFETTIVFGQTVDRRQRKLGRRLGQTLSTIKTVLAQVVNDLVVAVTAVAVPKTKPARLSHREAHFVADLRLSQTVLVLTHHVDAFFALTLLPSARRATGNHAVQDSDHERLSQRDGKHQVAVFASVGVSHTHGR